MWQGTRAACTVLHRWAGLLLAGVLVVAGLTGSLIAWFDELEAAFAPELFRIAQPHPQARPLDPLVLRERFLAAHPCVEVGYLPLAVAPGRTLWFFIEPSRAPAARECPAIDDEQVYLDPYTGTVVGTRQPGDLSQGLKSLMPFAYRLHYSLALGSTGVLLLGVLSLVWMLDCFIGAWLTLPAPHRTDRAWWRRWRPAWGVRRTAGAYRFTYDLHRAGGLWTWAMLLVLAWSSVAFNLPQLHGPVMRAFFHHQPADDALPSLAAPRVRPRIGWHEARDIGRRLMAQEGRRHGFEVLAEVSLSYDAGKGSYRYVVRSSRDLAERRGDTRLVLDGDDGTLRHLWLPTGAAGGDTVYTWLTGLHTAALWGWPMRLFICTMGLIVTMLSVTGLVVWSRKRSARAGTRAAAPRARRRAG